MTRTSRIAAAALGVITLAACNSLDVGDLNNPGLEGLQQSPTPAALNVAATGLLVGLRVGIAEPNGWITILGALGRGGAVGSAICETGYWVVIWVIATFVIRPPWIVTDTPTSPRRLAPCP